MSDQKQDEQEQIEKATVQEAGAKGGKARAANLTAGERKESAAKAAAARWGIPQATHAGEIELGGQKVPCAVLDNEMRVLTQDGFLRAIGRTGNPTRETSSFLQLPPWLDADNLKPFITNDLRSAFCPFTFRTPATGTGKGQNSKRALGYDANLLPMVCEVYMKAKAAGATTAKQEHIVQACTLLLCGLARVAITALIDEATGYQDFRSRDALAKILEAFIAKELRPYIPTFPTDFYKEMFRLRNIEYVDGKVKRPGYIGHLTNDLVYARLAPGVLDELRVKNPTVKSEAGKVRRRAKHHQWLTGNIGHPKLEQHLDSVVSLMKAADNWEQFRKMINRAKPIQIELPLFDHLKDESKGEPTA